MCLFLAFHYVSKVFFLGGVGFLSFPEASKLFSLRLDFL